MPTRKDNHLTGTDEIITAHKAEPSSRSRSHIQDKRATHMAPWIFAYFFISC